VDRLLLRPTEVAYLLSISRAKLYQLLARGELASIKIGTSQRIPAETLREWIAQQVASQSKEVTTSYAG
jgi:excisionase family DNA binding protein